MELVRWDEEQSGEEYIYVLKKNNSSVFIFVVSIMRVGN